MSRERADYVMPDGCEPFPPGIWERLTDKGVEQVIELIGDQLPGRPGFTLEAPAMSEAEKASLQQLGHSAAAEIIDSHLRSLG